MSAATQRRYRDARVDAFRTVLVRWLAKLPADGWEGGVDELGEALWKIARGDPVPTHIPFGSGMGRVIAAEQGVHPSAGVCDRVPPHQARPHHAVHPCELSSRAEPQAPLRPRSRHDHQQKFHRGSRHQEESG